jgi:hypothetical protein
MERIIVRLKPNILPDEKTGTQPDRQPGDIDGREELVIANIPKRDKEIVFEHDDKVW